MRCSACPGTHACLGPDGPHDADILFIGEAPGKDENRRGRVFIGKTGQEVDRQYLPLAGLRRDAACFINAISCLPNTVGGKLDPTRTKDVDLLVSCASERLAPFILSMPNLKLIVPMGRFATMAVCPPSVNLELQHGMPCDSEFGVPAFPMYHPALGIHEPKKMVHLRCDWDRLRRYVRGKLTLPTDAYDDPDYHEVTDAEEIRAIPPTATLGADTESKRGGDPYCLTLSAAAGTGLLIRADNRPVLTAVQELLDGLLGRIAFHNWLYDYKVVARLGLRMPHRRLVDTMAEAYHLGLLPQGLKDAAFRELGMAMEDFEEVVSPYSKTLVLAYYQRMQERTWAKPEAELKWDDKTQLYKLYQPQSLNTKLKRFFTDYKKNPDKDVFKMMEENWAEWQPMIEEEMGELYPGMCISHAPFDVALYYACRDSDATRRYYLDVILPVTRMVRKFSPERWRDAVIT